MFPVGHPLKQASLKWPVAFFWKKQKTKTGEPKKTSEFIGRRVWKATEKT